MRKTVLAAAALAAPLLLSGCGVQSLFAPEPLPQPGATESTAIVLVAAAHQTSPVPVLSGATRDLVATSFVHGGAVKLVTIDGRPGVRPIPSLEKLGGTVAGNQATAERNLMRIEQGLALPPDDPGADPWAAIALGAKEVRALDGQNPTVIVIGSLLGDTGLMDTTREGLLDATPEQLVGELRARHQLLDLGGVRVVLSGIDSTTLPQEPLSPRVARNFVAGWTAAMEASGAEVVVDTATLAGGPVETGGLAVRTSPVPTEQPLSFPVAACEATESVFDGRSAVRFHGDETTLVDASGAREALVPIARWLAADPARAASLLGTTARARSTEYQVGLGQRRADAVAALLVEHGARPEQLATTSLGSHFPEYVPDRDAAGKLIPAIAEGNRSIRITLHTPC